MLLKNTQRTCGIAAALLLAFGVGTTGAHEIVASAAKTGAPAKAANPSFDIVKTGIKVDASKRWVEFTMQVSGIAGDVKPGKTGKFAGTKVFSYVWPTKIDPAEVGFDAGSGILALAVTAHPDFDDTPLFSTKGADWHTHWVVLAPDDECAKGALKVKDIPEGSKPRLPKTWPGVPLLIDSPGYAPNFEQHTVSVRVPFDNMDAIRGTSFDGVTAGLRINASAHNPLLCVENVFDVASGDLSLPGKAD
ncbi:hypothetical protein [Paraherbaspirillum soli]|uniref:Uncharacterized protein n=1 Tax=Paraherbaspirillum soli TaxID=631222 RepID=A0ABW0M658_9BURK